MNHITRILTVISFVFLVACGGGGGGGDGGAAAVTPVTPETPVTPVTDPGAGAAIVAPSSSTAVITFVLQGTGAAAVKGIQASIALPAGVSVAADASGVVVAGVVTPRASAPSGYLNGKYAVAANGVAASLVINFATLGHFSAGDALAVNVDLAPGVTAPPASAYTLNSSKLVDAYGNTIDSASLSLR